MTQKPRLLRAAIVLVVAGSLGPALSGQTGASSIELLSVTPGGTAGGGQVFLESVLYDRGPQKISADNRYVVFASGSDQLVAGDVNGRQDIFVRDRADRHHVAGQSRLGRHAVKRRVGRAGHQRQRPLRRVCELGQ